MTDAAIVKAVGDLEGTVRALDRRISDLSAQWRHQDDAANAGRKALHIRMDTLAEAVTTATTTLTGVKTDVEEIKRDVEQKIMPTISAYNLEMARRAGMWLAGKLFWAVILATATVVGFFIHEGVQYLRGSASASPSTINAPRK